MKTLTQISFFFYAMAALCYLLQLVFRKAQLGVVGRRLTLVSALFQGAGFAVYLSRVGYPFLLDSADSYLFSAWVLSLLFLILNLKYRFEIVGVFFLAAILVLYSLAHFIGGTSLDTTGVMLSPWASVHIVLGFLAFSVFFLSFILGLLFLLQEFQLKRKKIWPVFDRFPSLELLDDLHYNALSVGFVLLTLGIMTGSAWAKSVKGVYFFNDPRQLWSIIAWLVYAVFFQARFSAGWRGGRGGVLSLMGFLVLLFTFLEVRHV